MPRAFSFTSTRNGTLTLMMNVSPYSESAGERSVKGVIHPLIWLFSVISGIFCYVLVVSAARSVSPVVWYILLVLQVIASACIIFYVVDHIRTEKFFSQRLILVAASPIIIAQWFVVSDVQRFASVSLMVALFLFCLAFNKGAEIRYQTKGPD